MGVHRGLKRVSVKARGNFEFIDVDGVHSEHIAVNDRVVPRWRRSVVAVPEPSHIGIFVEPHRVVIQSVYADVCGVRALAAGRDGA